jgi:hypothetical protein
MRNAVLATLVSVTCLTALPCSSPAGSAPGKELRVVIIRHGEKRDAGDNLSCQGLNRALALPTVLFRKFKTPDYLYVPSVGAKKSASHARMFETAAPLAIKYGLAIDSEFDVDAYPAIADRVLRKSGTVLMVWEHVGIPSLAAALGVSNPPVWKKKDFDSIWVITFMDGKAQLSLDKEGLSPLADCSF